MPAKCASFQLPIPEIPSFLQPPAQPKLALTFPPAGLLPESDIPCCKFVVPVATVDVPIPPIPGIAQLMAVMGALRSAALIAQSALIIPKCKL